MLHPKEISRVETGVSPLPDNTLLITPAHYSLVPSDLSGLLADLRNQGLIGEPIGAAMGSPRYRIGDAYPRLLSFMGCSPYFKTEPESADDRDFCHLEILGPWPTARLLGRLDDAWPRCPSCRKADRSWNQHGRQPAAGPDSNHDAAVAANPEAMWTCPHCATEAPWGTLDWRQRAGYARLALVLHHVYEGEAVPGGELLKTLSGYTGNPWTWFYA